MRVACNGQGLLVFVSSAVLFNNATMDPVAMQYIGWCTHLPVKALVLICRLVYTLTSKDTGTRSYANLCEYYAQSVQTQSKNVRLTISAYKLVSIL